MQVKTAVRYHLTPARIAVIKNDTKKTNVGGDVKKRELLYPVIENINWYRHCVQWLWKYLKKREIQLPCDSASDCDCE